MSHIFYQIMFLLNQNGLKNNGIYLLVLTITISVRTIWYSNIFIYPYNLCDPIEGITILLSEQYTLWTHSLDNIDDQSQSQHSTSISGYIYTNRRLHSSITRVEFKWKFQLYVMELFRHIIFQSNGHIMTT
jgi:hypothetical protein